MVNFRYVSTDEHAQPKQNHCSKSIFHLPIMVVLTHLMVQYVESSCVEQNVTP